MSDKQCASLKGSHVHLRMDMRRKGSTSPLLIPLTASSTAGPTESSAFFTCRMHAALTPSPYAYCNKWKEPA